MVDNAVVEEDSYCGTTKASRQIIGRRARDVKPDRIEVSGMFKAVLACLLGEVWTTPHIEELRPDDSFLPRPASWLLTNDE